MPLNPGTRVGPYEITAPIGAGGMGEVYRATDTRLKREVAIKVLPAMLASDPDRLARFQREAEVLASLNHPNIAHIHGLEEGPAEAGPFVRALVMELVEGPTLADRLSSPAGSSSAGLPVAEALAIAAQIADALEGAHERSVVHRDLKPVRPDGAVKVLDFGLAKLNDPNASNGSNDPNALSLSPTITSPAMMTGVGMILGTAAYMAPEQARGKAVDRRADIWAFGCVLYEMLTGRRAFEADDVSLTLARVLERDVDLEALPADVPPRVRQTLSVCLRKDPKQRAGDIRDVRLALEGAFESPASPSASAAAPVAVPRWRRGAPVAAALVVGLVLGALTLGMMRAPESAAPADVTQFEIELGDGQPFSFTDRQMFDISPDGTRIVYATNGRLYLRSLSEWDARPVSGTEGFSFIGSPVFSPDGQSSAFFTVTFRESGVTLKKIPVSGGVPTTLATADDVYGLTWVDDWVVYGDGLNGIARVPANGGRPEQVVKIDAGQGAGNPHLLPGHDAILFTVVDVTGAVEGGSVATTATKPRVVAQSLATGERKTLLEGVGDARYLPSGHLVYFSDGVVLAAPFDAGRLSLTGAATPVLEGVRQGSLFPHLAISATGTLVYVPGPVTSPGSQWKVARIDRKGVAEALPIEAGAYGVVSVSPDGRQLARGSDSGSEAAISIYDLSGTSAPRRLTFQGRNRFPVWSNDGTYVAFQSDKEGDQGIFRQRADGTEVAERLTQADKRASHIPTSWAPDGSRLLYDSVTSSRTTLWSLTMTDRKAAPVGAIASTNLTGAVFSPDGRWIAYSSREGRPSNAVFVEPFPPTGAKQQVSKDQDDGLTQCGHGMARSCCSLLGRLDSGLWEWRPGRRSNPSLPRHYWSGLSGTRRRISCAPTTSLRMAVTSSGWLFPGPLLPARRRTASVSRIVGGRLSRQRGERGCELQPPLAERESADAPLAESGRQCRRENERQHL